MTLQEYLDKYKISVTEFSMRSRIGTGSLWQYLSGRCKPRQEAAERIEVASNGSVTVIDSRGKDDRKKSIR